VTTSGSATFTRVKIDGRMMPPHPAPNTTLHLPGARWCSISRSRSPTVPGPR
jgi:hypothetical protein